MRLLHIIMKGFTMVLSLSIDSLVFLKSRHTLYLVLWKIEVGVSHSLSHSQQYKKLFTFQLALRASDKWAYFLTSTYFTKTKYTLWYSKEPSHRDGSFDYHNMF